jgi:acetyltransferase-like isoleucine patch superfamily enzyme
MKGQLVKRLLGKLAMVAPGGYTLRPWLHRIRGVQIGENVWISQYVYIDEAHPENVVIKDNVTIGLRCTIFAHFYLGAYSPDEKGGNVVIEKGAFIGPNCTILNGVTIGERSVVVAGSVVTKNVPPGVLFGPAPSGPLARITHPLTSGGKVDYEKFLFGLKKL